MKVVTSYNNFARGKIDHDALGRFDLPIYTSGSDIFRNFESNYKGNAIFRAGFEYMLGFQDCAFVEFRFSNNQNYIIVMYATKMRFLSYDSAGNFGWVLDGSSNILEVTTPYTLDQCKYIAQGKPAQNADVMVFTHTAHPPKDLRRISANSFTFVDHVFVGLGSPFAAKNATISGATQANPCVITANAHGFRSGDAVTISGVAGMTQLNGNTYTIDVLTVNTFSLRGINSTGFTAYTSGGTAARAADFPDCALFYRSRLYFSTTPRRLTTIWGSASAQYDTYDLPATTTATSPLQFTVADITQRIEWLFGGDNSMIAGTGEAIVAINGGNVGDNITASTIEATITSADGCNHAYPLRKDGLVFYVGVNDRNVYFFKYDLLTESFVAQDANLVSFDITAGGFDKLRYKRDRNDLVYFRKKEATQVKFQPDPQKGYCSLNFKERENIVGWHEHVSDASFEDIAIITNNEGQPQLFALRRKPANIFSIERQAQPIEFAKRADFFSGADKREEDDEAYTRYVAEQLRDCIHVDSALYYSDRRDDAVFYKGNTAVGSSGNVIAAPASAASFSAGDVGRSVVVRTATGYESGRFEITGFNSSTDVSVTVLQSPKGLGTITIPSGPNAGTWPTWADWYLTFRTISGVPYDGTVAAVTDGGYRADFQVTGGAIDFGSQISSVVIGSKYEGIIKSFSLGFTVQGANTQTTLKSINRVGIRTVSSAGGKVGSTRYHLEPVQELTGNEINYLPPIPIDGTKYIVYTDESEFDKYFYIVQDQPLPFVVAAAMVEAEYAVRP